MSDEARVDYARSGESPFPRVPPRSATELMGPEGVRSRGHPNIFPNLWITLGGTQICLRLPRGPSHTELWWFTFVPKGAPAPFRQAMIRMATHLFGPAGLLEQDDGENWSQSTAASRGVVSRRYPQNLQMAMGQDEVLVDPSGQKRIETRVNEHAQRWTYKCWAEWLRARDWPELMATRSPSPTGRI